MTTTRLQSPGERPKDGQPIVVLAVRENSDFASDPLARAKVETDLIQCLISEASTRGWRLLDWNLSHGLIQEQPPAGAIVSWLAHEDVAVQLRAMGCPAIRVGRLPQPGDELLPTVVPDFVEAGRMAADYFAQRGFRDLALISHESMAIREPLETGFLERAKAHGCNCHQLYFQSTRKTHSVKLTHQERDEYRRDQLTQWIQTLPRPLGLLCCQSHFGANISTFCSRVNLSVPEDVAVMLLENNPTVCELAPVPVSAINFDRLEQVRVSMGLLEEMMQGQTIPDRTFVRPRGIVNRRSTDILAVDNPIVVRAIRFIWDHLDQNLSVDDIAEEMKTPRYKLERMFRQYASRGINAELRRIRLEKFRELLRTTDLPLNQLAPRVGFNCSKYLHKAFRKKFDITPRQYRISARKRDG